jgi:hypothetical protein
MQQPDWRSHTYTRKERNAATREENLIPKYGGSTDATAQHDDASLGGGDALLGGDDQVVETGERLGALEELVAQQVARAPALLHVHLQRAVDEVAELRRQRLAARKVRLPVRRYQIDGLSIIRSTYIDLFACRRYHIIS